MKEKLKYFFNGIIKNNYKLIIFYIILILLAFIKLDYQIFSPGSLIDLNKKISIENAYESEGSFNLTYVNGRPGTILFILASYIIPSWDLIPMDESRIENETEEEINERNKIYLNDINENAIIVAFSELGMEYEIKEKGVSVLHVYAVADTNLEAGDIITNINNIKIKNIEDFTEIIENLKENQKINLKILRHNKEIEVYANIKRKNDKSVVGVSITNEREIITNPKVKFKFKDNEVGPSGGLMTTLKIYDMLTKEDITKGRTISGTGTINTNGTIGEISGVKYKLAGSVKEKADIFLCPTGNYKECIDEKEKNNYDIKIIEADTFKNVLNKLNN